MALTQVNNGDTGLVSRNKINAGFTQTDTNETDITALELNPLLQYEFHNLLSGDVINSTTSYVDSGLEVIITPRLSTSKLIVSFSINLELATSQTGFSIQVAWSDDNFSTETTRNLNTTLVTNATTTKTTDTGKLEITNLDAETKVRLRFSARIGTFNVTFEPNEGAFLDVSEIRA